MIIVVFAKNTDGKWFGQCGNNKSSKMGWFPFNRVEKICMD